MRFTCYPVDYADSFNEGICLWDRNYQRRSLHMGPRTTVVVRAYRSVSISVANQMPGLQHAVPDAPPVAHPSTSDGHCLGVSSPCKAN